MSFIETLKAAELPSDVCVVYFGDRNHEIPIHAIGGKGQLHIAKINKNDDGYFEKLAVAMLIFGADFSKEEAELVIDRAPIAAKDIANAIDALTKSYIEEVQRESAEAEKN